jgi:two-component system, NarL family, nitrate/nitrite response regulator NarL
MPVNDLRVLLVADDPLVRGGLAALLADQPGVTITGQMAGNADLLAGLGVYTPDVVVWDLGWDPTPSLERLADLRDAGIPVVGLLADETHAANTWIAGARGLLLRSTGVANLVAALASVARGLVVLDPAIGAALLSTRDRLPLPPGEELTSRELEVLQYMAEGLPNKAIAARLNISEHTVKFHVNAILGKLGAQSRTEAVVRASRLGLIIL